MKRKAFISLVITAVILFAMLPMTRASALSIYAGVTKSGYTYKGVAAKIKTPTSLPKLGDSGESCWVSNFASNGDWIQTGFRYYSGYSGFKTYVETMRSGVYNLTEIGTHITDATIHYKVNYEDSDGKWHAYIAGYDKGSLSMSSSANVQANGETHASNTQLGPFQYVQMVYRNESDGQYDWNWNDTTPTAQSPYHVTITDNANFKIYGP